MPLNASGRLCLTHTRLDGKLTLRFSIGQTNTERRHVETGMATDPGSGGRYVPNSGRRRPSWLCSRCTIELCIWLTRLSERFNVAPISFIVNSS